MASPNRVFACFILLLLLVGCTPPVPVPTASPPPPTARARLETLVLSSATPKPSATVTLTHTPAASVTITLTPTPAPAFEQVQILAVESVIGGVRVTLQLPNVLSEYKLTLRGYEYKCTLDPQVKDRLFCFGLGQIPAGQKAALVLSDPASGEQVYAADVFYAGFFTSTPQGNASNDCPSRGENAGCETECRQLPEGGYCVVATCTDACGLYFSVNTCPSGMSMDFNSCTEEQWADARLRYSLP